MKNKTRVRITESDLHRIVRKSVNKVLNEGISQEQLYSEEELNDAIQVIRKRVYELLSILGKRSNVLTYIIDPGRTAIDGDVKAHLDVYDDLIYRNIISRPNLEYDGNYGYDLLDLAKMIKNGEL